MPATRTRVAVMLLVAFVCVALVGGATSRHYIGTTTVAPPVSLHATTGDAGGRYLGVSEGPHGPFNALGSVTLSTGLIYEFEIKTYYPVYISTDASGGGAGQVMSPVVTGGSIQPHVGTFGDVLVVNATTLSGEVYYQSMNETDMGWVLPVSVCADVPPEAPTLLEPADGATDVEIGTPLRWSPVDFGWYCPGSARADGVSAADIANGKTPFYRVLLKNGPPPLTQLDVPFQGQQDVPADEVQYALSDASVTPGLTYSWQVLAYNGGNFTAASAVFSFTTRETVAPANGTALANGVVNQFRIFPDVPVSFSKYAYYSLEVSSLGGTLSVMGSTSPLDVVGAPGQGSISIFVGVYNTTDPSMTKFRPTATDYDYRSEEEIADPSTLRRSVLLNNLDAPAVYIGVQALSGSATFALSATYACAATATLANPTGTSCTACPANMEAAFVGAVGSTATSCVCQEGFYGPTGGPCLRCPVGALCDGRSLPTTVSGYWSDLADPSFVYRCPFAPACLGNSVCAKGYRGELCSECDKDYYRINGRCYECPSSPGLTFFFGVVILLLFLALTVELARWYRKITSVTVMINFIQTCAIVPVFQLRWRAWLVVFLNDLSSFNLNPELTAPDCSVDMTWTQQWLFTMFFPVMVGALCSSIYVVIYAIRKYQRCRSVEYPIKTSRAYDIIVPTYLTFLVFFYMSITTTVLTFFDCTEQTGGSEAASTVFTLDVNASMLCYDSDWYALLPLAVIGVLVYVLGIPLGIIGWLLVRHKKLYSISLTGDKMYRWLGPMYLRFHPSKYLWVGVIFLRKLLLIATAAFLTSFTTFQISCAVLILVVSLYLQLLYEPYAYDRTNALEAVLLVALIILFLVGSLFASGQVPNNSGTPEFIFAIVVIVFICAFAFGVFVVFRELRDVYRPITEEELLIMEQKLHEISQTPGAGAQTTPAIASDSHNREAPAKQEWTSSSASSGTDSSDEDVLSPRL